MTDKVDEACDAAFEQWHATQFAKEGLGHICPHYTQERDAYRAAWQRLSAEITSIKNISAQKSQAIIDLANAVSAKAAELETLRNDAERYRWLRDVATADEVMSCLRGLGGEWDAAIDAALTEQRGSPNEH